jgi:SAM-dependent methyltransferase
MADAYAARPDYPASLVDAVALCLADRARIADVGAGIGHLALPLARRGLAITAIEAALGMRDALETRAKGLPITVLHATAEALPFRESSLDAALICDAIHFLDVARAGAELRRTLVRGAVVIVITCEMTDTPFMRAVRAAMEEAAPRRPRRVDHAIARLFTMTDAAAEAPETFDDATPVDPGTLVRILESISFIGPAMNAERSVHFRERVLSISEPPVWSRRFVLHAARVR